jgi:hypothetical protein
MSLRSEVIQEQGHIYYNAILYNSGKAPILTEVTDQRNQAIVDVPHEYEASIIRFLVSGSFIPIFIPDFQEPPAPIPTTTIYSVTLTNKVTNAINQTFVVYTPSRSLNVPPYLPGYWAYQDFLDDVNTALATSFAAVQAGSACTIAPRFYFNELNELIVGFAEDTYLTTNPSGISVSMNASLFNFFVSFPSDYFGDDQPNGVDYTFSINPNTAGLVPPPPRYDFPISIATLPQSLVRFTQEFNTLYNWNSVRSIVFTSGRIPVNNEYIPNSVTSSQDGSVSTINAPILTDFEPEVGQSTGSNQGYLQYVPQIYRIFNLLSNLPLKVIDLHVYWSTKNGKLYPLYLAQGATMSVKIMFRKRKT